MTRRRDENLPRGHGYLFTGLVLGFVLGLAVSWGLFPVRYRDVDPASLHPDFKATYRALIAVAYWARPDPVRATARLGLLQDPSPVAALQLQAQKALTQSPWPWEAEALAALALMLQGQPLAVPTRTANAMPTPFPATPTPQPSPPLIVAVTATPTEVFDLTPTPAATQATLFRVVHKEPFCDPLRPALLVVEVYDAEGKPLPGVVLEVAWKDGQERLVTGMKPEMGLGYADVVLDPAQGYRLRVVTGSEIVTGLQPLLCRTVQGERYPGGWTIRFQALP